MIIIKLDEESKYLTANNNIFSQRRDKTIMQFVFFYPVCSFWFNKYYCANVFSLVFCETLED